MAIYRNKYTLEFDDIIKGEFNDYKLEINKKLTTSTANNVYISAYNNSGENISQYDPVRVANGLVVKSKASDSSTMPSTGIATVAIPTSSGASNTILTTGVLSHTFAPVADVDYYVGQNGGVTDVTTGLSIIQKIGVQVTSNVFTLLDELVTLKGTGSPIQLNYNLVDDDILSPFRASYLDISFYKESLSDDYSELFAAENDAFKVTLKKNNVLFWQGWVGGQLASEPYASPPYPINLKAYDGIHLLKDIPYFTNADVFQAQSNQYNDRYGYYNITDIVEKCIYNTGVLNNVYYYINIKNNETTNIYIDFVTKTRIHHQTFLNGESDSMNMENVLKNILTSLGATIYQRDGSWCIVKISDFTTTTSPYVKVKSNWRADANPTETNYVLEDEVNQSAMNKISSELDFFQVDNNSVVTNQYPLKEVTIEQEFDHNMVTETTIDSVKDLGSSDPSGIFLFDEWEPFGTNILEAVVLRSEQSDLSESANLPKSFIEADAQAASVQMNYCDSYLGYPVSHYCKIDSATIKGLRAKVRARPLGASLWGDQSLWIMFSPQLKYNVGSTVTQKGFGNSKNHLNAMLNKTTLRITNEMVDTTPLRAFILLVEVSTASAYAGTFKIKVYKDRVLYFTSSTIVTADLPADGRAQMGYTNQYVPPYWAGNIQQKAGDFTVEFVPLTGNVFPTMYRWYLEGGSNQNYDFYQTNYCSFQISSVTQATTTNFEPTDQGENPIEGGNTTGVGNNVLNTNESAANLFQKDWGCASGEVWNPTRLKTDRVNNWTEYIISSNTDWNSSISNLNVFMSLFSGAKVFGSSGVETQPPFEFVYDVSYTDIKLLPLVTENNIAPIKQEYVIKQNLNFSSKINKKTIIGSGLFNVGSHRYVGFPSKTISSPNDAEKSWINWNDSKLSDLTMQHLLAASYMELYRISVRRLDGTHYGNYKYGDRLALKVNGTLDTLNGSQAKFYPMGVIMDLKMARTTFTGDDLLDNTGNDWQSTLTKTIKWIGENDITETETLT